MASVTRHKRLQIASSSQWGLSRLHRTKHVRDKPLCIAQALPPALKMACRAQFSTLCHVEIFIWTAFSSWIQIVHHFVNKSWFCKLDLWFNFTRRLKIIITFTYGRMIDTSYSGIKIIISSISFWPEARIRGQQISKGLSWTWIRTWPQISFQPVDFELIFVILKYELATVDIKSWMVWGSC